MSYHYLLAALLSIVYLSNLQAQQAGMFDALEPLYPDSGADNGKLEFSSDAPRGGVASVHVLIDRLATNSQVEVTCAGHDVSKQELLAVAVAQNTGLHSRTELMDGKRNPHVIRRAPFHVYDAIRPIKGGMVVANASGRLALRFEYPIPAVAEAGIREVKIHLQSGKWQQTLIWKVNVHAAAVPKSQPDYTNWFSVHRLASHHGHEPWSDGHWQTIQQAARLMQENRQTTFLVPCGSFMKWRDGSMKVDRERLDRYVKIFLKTGFTRIEMGHLARRENGEWNAKHLVTSIGSKRVDSPEGKALIKAQLKVISDLIKRHQLAGKALQHISDEPLKAHASDYVAVAKMVKQHLPGVPVFDATHCTEELVGSVDVWCPQLDIYWKNHDFFQQRLNKGEEVWVYTCLSPGGADLNRLLDQERTRCVLLSWLIVRDRLGGYLHWGLNHYRRGQDPFANSTPQFDNKPGPSRNFLPPGDTHVTYPDPDGKNLLSSVRMAAHRLGMEDAALLRQLQQRNPDKVQEIIGQLIKGPRDYVLDSASYRVARKQLLDLLAGS